MNKLLSAFRQMLDGARLEVLVAIFTRAIALFLNTGTILALTFFASPSEQGYYFTFLSLTGLTLIADVGLTTVVSHFVAHERAHLNIASPTSLEGAPERIGRIAALLRISSRWYLILACLLSVTLWVGGSQLLASGQHGAIEWKRAWILSATAASLDFLTLPIIALLFGLGFIKSVYTLRALKAVVIAAVLWSGLALGFGLMAISAATIAGTLTVAAFVWVRYGPLLISLMRTPLFPVRWREEILPMQWRMAVSWIAGYFVFQTLTPIAFHLRGPILAGQVGATMGLFQAVVSLSLTAMESQQTKLGIMVARGDKGLFRTATMFGSFAGLLACLGVLGCITILVGGRVLNFSFVERFLPAGPATILLAGAILHSVVGSIAIYLRSHKREPFMGISVAAGLIMAPVVFMGCWIAGGWGVALAFTGVSLCFSLPAALIVLQRFQRAWHRPATETNL